MKTLKKINRRGFTLLEAVGSFVILSLVLTTATILIVNAYNRSIATSRQVDAVRVGALVRDELVEQTTYSEVNTWLGGSAKNLTVSNCGNPESPFTCSLFSHEIDGILYDSEVVVSFQAPTTSSLTYRIIPFSVIVTYYGTRTVVIEGMIYDE